MARPVEVIPIPNSGVLGTNVIYLLRYKGTGVLIDAGVPGGGRQFVEKFTKLDIDARSIRGIVLTHGHLDHIGSVADLSSFFSAPIYAHKNDADWVEHGDPPYPLGVTPYGKAMVWAANRVAKMTVPGAPVARRLDNETFYLELETGVPLRLIYTPGHTAGSISALTEDGKVFVGDMAMNAWYLRRTPGLPILADNFSDVLASWSKMIEMGARIVYPAHGQPFSIEVIKSQLDRANSARA